MDNDNKDAKDNKKPAPKRTLLKWSLILAGLGTAVGGPVVAFSAPGWWASLVARWSSSPTAGASAQASGTEFPAELDPAAAEQAGAKKGSPEDPGPVAMAEAFRFDVTLRDLMTRWPRVSTSLPNLQLQGYRVPLVTGPAETDLAGALTYYFNSQQQVQRITFNGTTGDGRELAQLLNKRFGFRRRPTEEPSLFLYEVPVRRGASPSVLRMKVAPLLKASQPHQRFDVTLVIERPTEKTLVSRVLGERG